MNDYQDQISDADWIGHDDCDEEELKTLSDSPKERCNIVAPKCNSSQQGVTVCNKA